MLSTLRNKTSDNLQVILVIIMTIVILICFSVDASSIQFQPQVQTNKGANQQIQILTDPQIYKLYKGLSISIISDWGKRQQLAETLQRQKSSYVSSNQNNPINNQITNQPTNPTNPTNPHPIPNPATNPPVTRGKAGISAEQAAKSKKYIDLKNMDANSQLALQQKAYYEEKYQISKYPQLPFCIVVPSYKNVANNRYKQNMNSIIQQDYSNYRIVFIDDASQDDTGSFIKQYIKQKQLSDQKITVIVNQQRKMAMPNLYMAAHQFCKPYQIYMIVDGDDQLVGKQVFKHFNSIFSSQDVWVAYTNFISVRGSIGYSRPFSQTVMDKNTYRRSAFVISHLRAFYTKIFTQIKEQDLKDQQGNWYRAANDVAMYLPILQMSGKKVVYVPQISYMYNSNTGLNNHRVKLKQQKGNQRKIKTKAQYSPLEDLFTPEQLQSLKENTGKVIQLKKSIDQVNQEKQINQNQNQNQNYISDQKIESQKVDQNIMQ